MKRVLKAVLFDWGDTLMRWEWRDDLLEAGHRSGLAAIGRSAPEADALAAHFREAYLPLLWQPGMLEEVEYPELVRDLLADFEIEIADAELNAFLEAEHAAWNPARQLGPATPALLDGLRERGLVLGLVSNAMDPPWLLHCDLEQMKVAERLDVAVFSSEVGKRKPHQEIFRRALDALDVSADEALFVGDRLYEDVRGAAEVGMKTVQALWFRTDKHPSGVDPDFQALSPLDVLDVAERLLVRT